MVQNHVIIFFILIIRLTNSINVITMYNHTSTVTVPSLNHIETISSEEIEYSHKHHPPRPPKNLTINLADEGNSSEEITSHELLLKTSSKIKEAFVITSENNLIFIKEKHFDPAHQRHRNQGLNRNVRHTPQQKQSSTPGRNNAFLELKKWNFKQYGLQDDANLTNRLPTSDSPDTVQTYAYNFQKGLFCSFEVTCDWTWGKNNGFQVVNAETLRGLRFGPRFDADNNTIGKFLFLNVTSDTQELHVTSPTLAGPSGEQCRLELFLYQGNMNTSIIKIVAENTDSNKTQWIVHEMLGNSYRIWHKYEFKVGRITQEFKLILEIVPHLSPAYVAVDNIRLVDCYPEPAKRNMCVAHQFRCASTNVCVNVSQVCDISHDCKFGEDELQDCDKVPLGGRCDFESGWCGWQNDFTKQIQWSRSELQMVYKHIMDHTYHNISGHYLLVDMEKYIVTAPFAATASISSPIFNPPPPVHSNESSIYHNSCSVRFYYHHSGFHKSGLALMLVEMRPHENVTTEIWWSFADKEEKWRKGIVILPNITYRYYLQFNAKKGLRFLSIIALDDISFSPECFGLNIPAQELKGYNYWSPPEFVEPKVKETHKDFVNKTYYQFSTCGVRGKDGPAPKDCTVFYQERPLDAQVEVLTKSPFKGIQRWVVPSTGYYTVIAKGAGGGKGSGGMGASRGSTVKAIIELHKGERLYLLVGQEGRYACVKSLGRRSNSSCQTFWNDDRNLTGVRGVYKAILRDGGGGGGGATYIFRARSKNNKSVFEPLLVAGGGGGLGVGHFFDNAGHHGLGITTKKPFNGITIANERTSGAGGGWFRNPNVTYPMRSGSALEDGGAGGVPCYSSNDGAGTGGFGGGGGGCTNGGGGGGFAGGNSFLLNSTNGEGGTSYISNHTLEHHREVIPGAHIGSGMILIIPAESQKCGCNYRCVALDEHRAQIACICPVPDWNLSHDNVTCLLNDLSSTNPNILISVLILLIMLLAIGLGILCIMLYNRHQKRKTEISRQKNLAGPELQLNHLRMHSENNVLLTEYNPNYEFGGQVYTLKDLQDVPRDQLRLVKALGQGAFGEVYQGFYKARSSDAVEMPVAVKTLPVMSTEQAEVDFLMEALIMSKFNHPNIVHFIGVCFDRHPRFIVLELLAGGDLKNFLRESRPKPERPSPLSMKDLILIAIDVAKGCKYLEEHRFIHRDIAARNCLLTTKGPGRVVKIADFGMSRDIYRSDYYRKGGKAMLPIKWMPPEAFVDGIFTSKTDSWSFGVLLWEIMSMGFMPYTGCSNGDVMTQVLRGGRLEPPSNCPGPIYGIMTQCWHPTPEQRPTFAVLLERLGYCLQDPDVLNNPLPVFAKAPSAERDTTVIRPKNSDGTYLHVSVVPSTSDYLIPTPTVTSCTESTNDGSSETLLEEEETEDSWETSFMIPQSKSTQPLIQNDNAPTVDNLISIESPSQPNNKSNESPDDSNIKVLNHVNHTYNNNIKKSSTSPPPQFPNKDSPKLKSGDISLDPSNLLNETKKTYANIQAKNDFRTQNGPYSLDSMLNHKEMLSNDTEISC